MGLCCFNTVQRTVGGLRRHLHHIIKTIAGIRNGFSCIGNGFIQPQLAQTVAQHARQ